LASLILLTCAIYVTSGLIGLLLFNMGQNMS